MEKFIKFLEDNNAWENFERAFKDYHRDVKDYKETCKTIKNAELSSAFRWGDYKRRSRLLAKAGK